jgi:hypothetical protein
MIAGRNGDGKREERIKSEKEGGREMGRKTKSERKEGREGERRTCLLPWLTSPGNKHQHLPDFC